MSKENNTGHDPYASLKRVLAMALDQAESGKGHVRHSQGEDFTAQPMQTISGMLGSHVGLLFQAMKKIQESSRLPLDPAIKELLGAINYTAGAILYLQRHDTDQRPDEGPLMDNEAEAVAEATRKIGEIASAARPDFRRINRPDPKGKTVEEVLRECPVLNHFGNAIGASPDGIYTQVEIAHLKVAISFIKEAYPTSPVRARDVAA